LITKKTPQQKFSLLEKKRQEFQTKPVAHTPEARLQAARDLAAFREKDSDNNNTKSQPKQPDPVAFGPDGRVMQRNQGKWNFSLDTSPPDTIVLDIEISKFLDSSFIDVDVHPTWIRVVIKNKVLQLVLDEEVMTENVVCERSRLTGHLMVTMLKVKSQDKDIVEIVSKTKKANSERRIIPTTSTATSSLQHQRNRRFERLFDPEEAVDIRNIVKEEKIPTPASITAAAAASEAASSVESLLADSRTTSFAKIKDSKFLPSDLRKPMDVYQDFVDNPDVPPLC
jgi:protein TilB